MVNKSTKLTEEQRRKVLAAAEIIEGGDIAVLKKIIEFQDFLDEIRESWGVFTSQYGVDISSLEENTQNTLSSIIDTYNAKLEKLRNELAILIDENKIGPVKESIKELERSLISDIRTTTRLFDDKLKSITEKIPTAIDIDSLSREFDDRLSEIESKIPILPAPLLGEDFRNALEALPDGEKLSIDAIQDLREELEKIRKEFSKVMYAGTGPMSAAHAPRHEAFTMNGSDTSITLSVGGVGAQGTACIVRYNGQTLDLTSQYTVNGNKITLVGFTPEADTIISVTYWE